MEEYLYHFTSFESSMKIISSKTLKFSKLERMNDILESYRPIYVDGTVVIDDVEVELRKYRQISLSQDTETKPAFAISPMWGHYAQKGNGVCLKFNKQKLISRLQDADWYSEIEYKNDYDASVICDINDVSEFFKKNKDDLFFRKSNDWAYENEFRIVRKCINDEDEFIGFEDSLCSVIMCYVPGVAQDQSIFCSERYKELKHICTDIQILEYSYFFGEHNLRNEAGDSIWPSKPLNVAELDV